MQRGGRFELAFTILFLLLGSGEAFALECGRASKTWVDESLRTNDQIKDADAKMSATYFGVLKSLTGSDHELLLESQRRWLASRNELCGWPDDRSTSCLLELIKIRTDDIKIPFNDYLNRSTIMKRYLDLVSRKFDWQEDREKCEGKSEFELIDCANMERARQYIELDSAYIAYQHKIKIKSEEGAKTRRQLADHIKSAEKLCRKVVEGELIGRTADLVIVQCLTAELRLETNRLRAKLSANDGSLGLRP